MLARPKPWRRRVLVKIDWQLFHYIKKASRTNRDAYIIGDYKSYSFVSGVPPCCSSCFNFSLISASAPRSPKVAFSTLP